MYFFKRFFLYILTAVVCISLFVGIPLGILELNSFLQSVLVPYTEYSKFFAVIGTIGIMAIVFFSALAAAHDCA